MTDLVTQHVVIANDRARRGWDVHGGLRLAALPPACVETQRQYRGVLRGVTTRMDPALIRTVVGIAWCVWDTMDDLACMQQVTTSDAVDHTACLFQ